jgi:hypothetical protein
MIRRGAPYHRVPRAQAGASGELLEAPDYPIGQLGLVTGLAGGVDERFEKIREGFCLHRGLSFQGRWNLAPDPALRHRAGAA